MNVQICNEIAVQQNGKTYTLHVPPGGNEVELYSVALEILLFASTRLQEISKKALEGAPKIVEGDSDGAK